MKNAYWPRSYQNCMAAMHRMRHWMRASCVPRTLLRCGPLRQRAADAGPPRWHWPHRCVLRWAWRGACNCNPPLPSRHPRHHRSPPPLHHRHPQPHSPPQRLRCHRPTVQQAPRLQPSISPRLGFGNHHLHRPKTHPSYCKPHVRLCKKPQRLRRQRRRPRHPRRQPPPWPSKLVMRMPTWHAGPRHSSKHCKQHPAPTLPRTHRWTTCRRQPWPAPAHAMPGCGGSANCNNWAKPTKPAPAWPSSTTDIRRPTYPLICGVWNPPPVIRRHIDR